MNIFYLDPDPIICAQEHNDKHVVKMLVEYAQLMSTAHRVIDGTMWYGRTINGRRISRYFLEDGEMNDALYKASHINHPSNIWVRSSAENYEWIYSMWAELSNEYTHRYGKLHKSFSDLGLCRLIPPTNINYTVPFTEPPPAMKAFPECIVKDNSVQSYRNYYWEAKKDFSKWTKRDKPEWWNERERIETETPISLEG